MKSQSEFVEGSSMKEKTYHTRCGTIHYWASVSNPDEITLVFLPGLTAFFIPKFQIGVMKWCLLELFSKIIGANLKK